MTDSARNRSFRRRTGVACLLAALGGVAGGAHAQCGDWERVGSTNFGEIYALAVFDDGTGPALYASDRYANYVSYVLRWTGTAWSYIGGFHAGPTGERVNVFALEALDLGTGPALYAGGEFRVATGGVAANNVARWDASTGWSPLGDGIASHRNQEEVFALAAFGGLLYAGGAFEERFGNPGNNIARWNGTAWSRLGGGVGAAWDAVVALEVFNDGSGPALYVGHSSWHTDFINRWNGSSWSYLGTGTNGMVRALKVFNDGSGPALYAGGEFGIAGGNPVSNIARWDGSDWSALGSGINGTVRALAVFDDGTGPALYAAGTFTEAGGNPASNIARWDGTEWTRLGEGIGAAWNAVFALEVFDDGSGPSLYAAGRFPQAGGNPVSNIARWVPQPPCRADLNGDCVLDWRDFFLYLDLFGAGDPIADINGDGVLDADDFFAYLELFAAGC